MKMKKTISIYSGLRLLPVVAVLLLTAGMLFSAVAAKSRRGKVDWDSAARQRKAEYVFISAYQAIAGDSIGGGMNMLEYAEELAPDDPAITGNSALVKAAVYDMDSTGALANYEVIRQSWLHDTGDYFLGSSLAVTADRLGKYSDAVKVWRTLDSIYPTRTEPAQNLAQAYTRRYIYNHDIADYDSAIAIYGRIESESGKDVMLSSQKIRTLMLRNDTAAADAEVKAMLEAMPREVTALLFASMLNDQFGRDSLTLEYLHRAAALDSTDGRTYQQLSEYYRARGDSAAYSREVFRALESGNLEFDVKEQIMRGYLTELYDDSTQWPRINRLFEILGNLHSDEPQMHRMYGLFELGRGRYDSAREQFGYAVALDPGDDVTRQMLVSADYQADSLDAVLRDARPGLDLFPQSFYYPIALSGVLSGRKQFDEAIAVIRSVDIGDVRNPAAVSNLLTVLADTYHRAGNADSAIAIYDRAIALNRENYMAYNNAAYYMAVADRDLDRAERYAGYAIAAEPENPTYLDTYAWVKFKRRDYKDARTYIDKALLILLSSVAATDSVDSELAEVDSIAVVVDSAVMDSIGVPAFDLVEDDSFDEIIGNDILEHAGDIYYMCGFPDEAVRFWQRAAALRPEDSELLERKIKVRAYLFK